MRGMGNCRENGIAFSLEREKGVKKGKKET